MQLSQTFQCKATHRHYTKLSLALQEAGLSLNKPAHEMSSVTYRDLLVLLVLMQATMWLRTITEAGCIKHIDGPELLPKMLVHLHTITRPQICTYSAVKASIETREAGHYKVVLP